jgi:hypothetical protein
MCEQARRASKSSYRLHARRWGGTGGGGVYLPTAASSAAQILWLLCIPLGLETAWQRAPEIVRPCICMSLTASTANLSAAIYHKSSESAADAVSAEVNWSVCPSACPSVCLPACLPVGCCLRTCVRPVWRPAERRRAAAGPGGSGTGKRCRRGALRCADGRARRSTRRRQCSSLGGRRPQGRAGGRKGVCESCVALGKTGCLKARPVSTSLLFGTRLGDFFRGASAAASRMVRTAETEQCMRR